jgi:hypothetical protein
MRFGENDPWQPRLAVAAPLTRTLEPLSFTLPEQFATATDPWPVQLYYRGHVQRTELQITRLAPGQRLTFERARPQPARIIVKSDQRDSGSMVVIFDCSISMADPVAGELGTIMNVAKNALGKILGELSAAESYQFSLWFYGHRIGFDEALSRKRQNPLVNVCQWFNNRPEVLNQLPKRWCTPDTQYMSEDVALEWPADANKNPTLTKRNVQEVLELVDAAQPLGVTPLYHAIVKAVGNDANLKRNTTRRLVVLTDGKNNIRPLERRGLERWQDVRDAVKNSGIDLHIVAFGEVAQDFTAEKELKDILAGINQPRNYHKVRSDLSNFEEVIRNAMGLSYEVIAEGAKVGSERVNKQITLPQRARPTEYTVRIVGSDVPHRMTLEGGEGIDLFVAESGGRSPRLVHARFKSEETQTQTQASVVKAGGAAATEMEKFFVGFQQPESITGETRFRVWMQYNDERLFTPRPAEAWVEITPLVEGGQKQTPYVFYDLEFEEGKTVPMMVCRAANWPPEARNARVETFFKMRKTETELRRQLKDVEGGKLQPDLAVRLPGGGRVQFSVQVSALKGQEGTQVTVTEQCARPEDLRQAKVEIETPADTVQRDYFRSNGQCEVYHKFVFLDTTTSEVLDYRLRITSREDLERDAAKLHDIVELKVDR